MSLVFSHLLHENHKAVSLSEYYQDTFRGTGYKNKVTELFGHQFVLQHNTSGVFERAILEVNSEGISGKPEGFFRLIGAVYNYVRTYYDYVKEPEMVFDIITQDITPYEVVAAWLPELLDEGSLHIHVTQIPCSRTALMKADINLRKVAYNIRHRDDEGFVAKVYTR